MWWRTGKVGVVVARRDERLLGVFGPDPRRPVTDGQEVLGREGVPLEAVHRAVVSVERARDAVSGVLCLAVA